ncbi:globin [Actinoplanes sp. N902-109]|nr:globin [Actinoplanes sp. N902-109]
MLKESWSLVEERQDKVAGYFYARLFLSHPELRELFPVHMDAQRARLLTAVVTVMQSIDDPVRIDQYLHELGRDHRKFRVDAEHYEILGAALIEALRQVAGAQWDAEYDRAWAEAYAMITEKMLAGAAADTNPPFWHAEVVAHERRGHDIAVFTVRPLQPLDFRAGQHLSVECPKYQPRLWRPYSPANAPRRDNTIDFHVRAVGAGWVSGALVRRLQVGDMLRLAAPNGAMNLDRRSTRDAVFVAGSTGLAPVKSLLEELTRYNRTRWVHVFFGARTREDLYDLADLNRLAARYPWLSVVPACSEDPTYPGERGTIPDVVARYGPWNEHDFFVAGSHAMVRATLGTLAGLQVPAIRIKYDAFDEF